MHGKILGCVADEFNCINYLVSRQTTENNHHVSRITDWIEICDFQFVLILTRKCPKSLANNEEEVETSSLAAVKSLTKISETRMVSPE